MPAMHRMPRERSRAVGADGAAGATGAGGTTGASAASRHPVDGPHLEDLRQALPAPGAVGTGGASSLNLAEQRHLEEWRQALPMLCAIKPTVTIEADLVDVQVGLVSAADVGHSFRCGDRLIKKRWTDKQTNR